METLGRALWVSVVLLGCQGEPVVDLSTVDSSVADAASDGDSSVDSALIDSTTDSTWSDTATDTAMPVDAPAAEADATGDASPVASDPECGTHKGGPMVYSGGGAKFCIDAREVTRAEYDVFLKAASKPAQPPHCDWNSSFEPLPSAFGDNFPITGIDWCDALTYCAWADKHICGDLVTGAPTLQYTAAKAQWSLACTNGDPTATEGWATGPTAPAAGVCQIGGLASPSEVEKHPDCRGATAPWNRVRDMVGNVAEWDGSGCFTTGFRAGTTPAERMSIDCSIRGGFYANDHATGMCFAGTSQPIDVRHPGIGFRCCKGPFT